MGNILGSIDALICSYLGINSNETTPCQIKNTGGILSITNTEPFKRHIQVQKVDDFLNDGFDKLSNANKRKLGLAIGKSIAKNLVISFERTKPNKP